MRLKLYKNLPTGVLVVGVIAVETGLRVDVAIGSVVIEVDIVVYTSVVFSDSVVNSEVDESVVVSPTVASTVVGSVIIEVENVVSTSVIVLD